MEVSALSVKDNLQQINAKISEACRLVNRDENEVKIIAVTKYVSTETALEAINAGLKNLGENRDVGLLDKKKVIGDQAVWHFIGSLQTRKVKAIIDEIDYIHSLDRLSLAKEIHTRAKQKIKCLVQVNAASEDSKHGLAVDEVLPFIEQLEEYSNITVEGLMTMAPFTDNEDVLRDTFRKVRELQKKVQAALLPYAPCRELSMGMSNDYQIAIEEGATIIRIGTALVGKEF